MPCCLLSHPFFNSILFFLLFSPLSLEARQPDSAKSLGEGLEERGGTEMGSGAAPHGRRPCRRGGVRAPHPAPRGRAPGRVWAAAEDDAAPAAARVTFISLLLARAAGGGDPRRGAAPSPPPGTSAFRSHALPRRFASPPCRPSPLSEHLCAGAVTCLGSDAFNPTLTCPRGRRRGRKE